MTSKLNERSKAELATCDARLQLIVTLVSEWFDFTVIDGHRDRAAQDDAVRRGRSKVHWPHSKHNATPSLAVDIAPYPIDWTDRERFAVLAGAIIATGKAHGIDILWGGDWNRNNKTHDETFSDMPHFEIVEP